MRTWLIRFRRLESRYRYANKLVYNTFPWPDTSDVQKSKIEDLAQDVLDARSEFSGSSLADCYQPDLMPAGLGKAHRALDKAVDKLYRRSGFSSDRERVEHLFELYEKIVSPIETAAKKRKRRATRRKT